MIKKRRFLALGDRRSGILLFGSLQLGRSIACGTYIWQKQENRELFTETAEEKNTKFSELEN
jgi:hypothetical protein